MTKALYDGLMTKTRTWIDTYKCGVKQFPFPEKLIEHLPPLFFICCVNLRRILNISHDEHVRLGLSISADNSENVSRTTPLTT